MSDTGTISELRQRLDAIEKRLSDKDKEISRSEGLTAAQTRKIAGIRSKVSGLRKKLPEHEGSVWRTIRAEAHRDLKALENDFDHWVRYLDSHFKETE
jgi:predicted  nucleic acid-binding Zn-ribbon protein